MSARAGEKAALKVIGMVLDSGAFFNIALEEVLSQGGYTEQDRSAASAISRTVIESITALDHALGQVTNLARCKKPIRNILRIGASRLLYTNMQPAQAVSSAVDICRSTGKGAQAGYVNATLRALAKADITWPDYAENPAQHLAVKYSWPQWYCEEIIAEYGPDFAHDYLTFREHLPVSVRVNPHGDIKSESDKAGAFGNLLSILNGKQSQFDKDGILTTIANPAAHKAYAQGVFSLQGESSMVAARQALADGLVVDVCAAPGGKSTYIAERMRQGKVIACDIHPHRVKLIQAQAKRLGLVNVEAIEHDAQQPLGQHIGAADSVLVDAPCTGLGTALNRPDVKLNKPREDVAALAALQSRILESAAQMVKQGGKLVYCTCTPTRAETDGVVQAFLARHTEFTLAELDLSDGPSGGQTGILRLWPHIHGTDAFYICRMVKK